MDLLTEHEVFIGTYEQHTVGYKPTKGQLLPIFTEHGHSGSIRALSASGKFLVTGAADEVVKIYNLRNKTEHGNLHHHEGTINTLKFFGNKFLFTGGEDGKICILATKSWNVEKTLTKHTSGVIDISIHPSGKLALSIGKDKKLITWNLIKGRSAYVSNIKEVADFVSWSPNGAYYAVGFYKRVDIYEVSSAEVCYSSPLKGRSNAIQFIDEDIFIVAGEMPELQVYSLSKKTLLHSFEAHQNRVRCLHLERSSSNYHTLVSASNDGYIKFWKITNVEGEIEAKMVLSYDTDCRITCFAVHKIPPIQNISESPKLEAKKLKRKSDQRDKKAEVKPSKGHIVIDEEKEDTNDVPKLKKGKKRQKN